MAFMLLNSIPQSYDNLVTTLMWGWKEKLELEEILGDLLAFNQRRKASNWSSHGEGLMARDNQGAWEKQVSE